MKWERLIPVISFPSLQEPLGLQEGLIQRRSPREVFLQVEKPSGEDTTASLLSEQLGFVASGDTTGEHLDRTWLSILRICTFPFTFTSLYFQHMRRIRKGKMLSQAPGSSVCLFVSLWEERDFFDFWGAVRMLSQDSANYTPELVFKFCYLLWSNALRCSHIRTSAYLTREKRDNDFVHSLPSSQAAPNTPLTAALVRLWNS